MKAGDTFKAREISIQFVTWCGREVALSSRAGYPVCALTDPYYSANQDDAQLSP